MDGLRKCKDLAKLLRYRLVERQVLTRQKLSFLSVDLPRDTSKSNIFKIFFVHGSAAVLTHVKKGFTESSRKYNFALKEAVSYSTKTIRTLRVGPGMLILIKFAKQDKAIR